MFYTVCIVWADEVLFHCSWQLLCVYDMALHRSRLNCIIFLSWYYSTVIIFHSSYFITLKTCFSINDSYLCYLYRKQYLPTLFYLQISSTRLLIPYEVAHCFCNTVYLYLSLQAWQIGISELYWWGVIM